MIATGFEPMPGVPPVREMVGIGGLNRPSRECGINQRPKVDAADADARRRRGVELYQCHVTIGPLCFRIEARGSGEVGRHRALRHVLKGVTVAECDVIPSRGTYFPRVDR